MPVQLDWEIEEVETPLPDIEPEMARRPRGCRRWRLRFVLFFLAVAVGLAVLGYRIRQKQKEIENELRAAIELELKALISGDRDLFLGRQDPDDRRWQQAQEEAFARHQRQTGQAPWELAPQVPEYTGEIPLLRVQEDEAWAQVQVAHGEQVWRELWFYRWKRQGGWRHVRFDRDWLGEERALVTLHLRFAYPERDTAIVTALAHEMETWYSLLAPLLGTRPTRALLTVQFVYRDPASRGWSETRWVRGGFTLQAPAAHQLPLSADGLPTPELRARMAGHLAEALIGQQIGVLPNETLGPVVDALRQELRDWVMAHIADNVSDGSTWATPPTPLVDTLVAREGVEVLAPLVASLHRTSTLDQTLAAAGLDPPDPVTRFAFQLAALNRAFNGSDPGSYQALIDPQADSTWRQYHIDQASRRRESVPVDALWPGQTALQIESVAFNGPIAWVEAETTRDDGLTFRQTHFFRQLDERWLLTSPDPTYFGARQTLRTENLVFHYFEREAEWVQGTLPVELQAVVRQASTDLGIATERLVITVETDLQPGIDGLLSEDGRQMRFTSPHVAGWPAEQVDDQVLRMAVPLLGALLETQLQFAAEEDSHLLITFVGAFLWELERLFPQRIDVKTLLGIDTSQVSTASLAELWAMSTGDIEEADLEQTLVSFHALLEFLVEIHGPEVVPSLLDSSSQTDDLDEWLRLSTGQGLEEIEPAWQAWLLTTYGEP